MIQNSLSRSCAVGAFLISIWSAGVANAQVVLREPQPDGAGQVLYYQDSTGAYVQAAGNLSPGGRPTQAGDKFLTASVGKLYTATAIMHLHDQGLMDVDAPVSRYIPASISDGFGGLDTITVAMLLTMTSGLPDYLDDAFVAQDIAGVVTPVDAVTHAMTFPRNFAPGTAFDYSNTNYVLAQIVIENVSGRRFDAYLKQNIFAPIGDLDAFVIGSDVAPADLTVGSGYDVLGHYYQDAGFGDGAIVTTAQGTAAFYHALFGSQTLVSANSLARILDDPLDEGYGMGVEIENDPDMGVIYGHNGGDLGYSADVRFRRDTGAIAVLLAADEDADLNLTYDALLNGCTTC